MSAETTFGSRESQFESHTKQEWKVIKSAERVKAAALEKLKGIPSNSITGKEVFVRPPNSSQVFHIRDTSEIDAVKRQVTKGNTSNLRTALTIWFGDEFIEFPLQHSFDSTDDNLRDHWQSSAIFSNRKMRKFATQIKIAVPLK